MVNNAQKEYSEIKRAAREADAIENCAEYIPGNRSYIIQGIVVLNFRVLSGPVFPGPGPVRGQPWSSPVSPVHCGVSRSYRWYSLNNYGF